LRPCNFASDSLVDISPLKASVCRGVNFNIVRELTGGIYFGDRIEDDGSGYAMDTEPYHRHEVERIIRLAAHLALQENPPAKVWSLDKANVLATSRMWRKIVDEIMTKEFPQLKYEHQLIDSAAMLMVKTPTKLNGIIVTSNLFGDIISDEASVIPGSLGLLPSASLTGIPDGKTMVNGVYEPIHGMCDAFKLLILLTGIQVLLLIFQDWKLSTLLRPSCLQLCCCGIHYVCPSKLTQLKRLYEELSIVVFAQKILVEPLLRQKLVML
jgi:isocitrate/isopropylmalate dehydrogenase